MNDQVITSKTSTKNFMSTKVLVSTSLLTGLSIILARFFGLMLPIAGLPALRLSFGSIPIIIAGIIFGPVAGALSGIVADLIGYMTNPMGGVYFPGFTLSAALSGAIPGLLYKIIKSEKIKFKVDFNIINTLTILILAFGVVKALFINDLLKIKDGSLFYLDKKLSIIYVLTYIAIVLVYIGIPILMGIKRGVSDNLYSIDKIFFVVSFSYLLLTIGLNTYWLSLIFSKGYLVFLPTRVIFGFIKIPLNTMILFSLSKFFNHIN